jgi:hypothetical protein
VRNAQALVTGIYRLGWNTAMLKFLILLPLICIAASIGGALLLPLLALAPLLIALALAIVLPVLILRVVIGLVFGLGGLVFGLVGVALALAAAAVALAFGIVLIHLALPVLFVVGLIWLIRRASRPAPLLLEHHPG